MKKIFIFSFIVSLSIFSGASFANDNIGSCAQGHGCVCVHYDESQFTSKYTYTDIYGVEQSDNVNLKRYQYIDLGDPNSGPSQTGLNIEIQYSNGSSWKGLYNGPLYNRQTLTITGPIGSPDAKISNNTCNPTN